MEPHTVVFMDRPDVPYHLFFECLANDVQHAREQWKNAYPKGIFVRVDKGHREELN